MTIRDVAEKYGIGLTATPTSTHGTALVFVINRNFLPGLKVLLYSMAKQETLLDLPIIFLSEDATLLDDDFVATAGDQFRHVSEGDISKFQGISKAGVPETVRLEWIPKYTFLKWMIYDDYGHDRLIWVDADILCLGPVDILTQLGDADLYAAPTFPRKLLYTNNSPEARPRSEDDARKQLGAFLGGGYQTQRSLNSGVMVINKALLTGDFRPELIRWAESHQISTEQQVVNGVIEASDNLTREHLSPMLNFNHSYLPKLDTPELATLKSQVRLLHYVGARSKPWEKRGPLLEVESYRLWHDHLREAERRHPIFGLPRE